MPQPIVFQCPVCQVTLTATVEQAGAKIPCPRCQQRLQIPRPPINQTILGTLDLNAKSSKVPAGAAPPERSAAVPRSVPASSEGWYWTQEGKTFGPVPLAELQRQVTTKQLSTNHLVFHASLGQWTPAASVAGLFQQPKPQAGQPLATNGAPVAPPKADQIHVSSVPWNPVAIAWLGLLFSPVWVGIMAALNGRRLRTAAPRWRPLTIAVGALALDLFIQWFVSYRLADFVLYGGAVWLIWFLDLRPQREAFLGFRQRQPNATAGWGWPSAAGAPLAFVVVLVFVGGCHCTRRPGRLSRRRSAENSTRPPRPRRWPTTRRSIWFPRTKR